ncbi:MAG: hypothetical protein QOI66_3469 [Myxococcales bacterium]|jgi:hypothetical protein|nr:hypothetical protein [Myxococcales bacterium]
MALSIYRRLAWAALLSGLSLASSASSAARAETPGDTPERAAARTKLVQGVTLLKSGDYSGALSQFQDAYRLVPSPNIHYDLGLAYVGLGRPVDALEAFDRFLSEAPDAPAATRQKAEADAELMRGRVATVTISVDKVGAEVLVDGNARGVAPLPRALYLDPGRHDLAARQPGGALGPVQSLKAEAGAAVTVSLHLPAVVAAPDSPAATASVPGVAPPAPPTSTILEQPPTTTSGASQARVWALSSSALGVALLGTGVTFALLARSEGDSLTDLSRQSMKDNNHPEFPTATESRGRTYDTLAWVGLGAGVVALAAGAIILVTSNRRSSPGPLAGTDFRLVF